MFEKTKYQQVEREARHLADSISDLIKEGGEGKKGIEKGKEMVDEARRYAKETGHEVDRFAHEHVWTTAGIAAGVGAVVGVIVAKITKR